MTIFKAIKGYWCSSVISLPKRGYKRQRNDLRQWHLKWSLKAPVFFFYFMQYTNMLILISSAGSL